MRKQTITIGAPIVAQLQLSHQHPRATLLYLRLLTLPPQYWLSPTQLRLRSEAELWEQIGAPPWPRVEMAWNQSAVAWGSLDLAWAHRATPQAFVACRLWKPWHAATRANLQRYIEPALAPAAITVLERLWSQKAWCDELVDLLAQELPGFPHLPLPEPGQFIKETMRGITAEELRREWDWLSTQRVVQRAQDAGGLRLTLAREELLPPPAAAETANSETGKEGN